MKPLKVRVTRLEGKTSEVDKPVTVYSVEEGSAVLNVWRRSAPKKGGGYDKCDVTLLDAEDDAIVFKTRVDIQEDVSVDLREELLASLRFQAGYDQRAAKLAAVEEWVEKTHRAQARMVLAEFFDEHEPQEAAPKPVLRVGVKTSPADFFEAVISVLREEQSRAELGGPRGFTCNECGRSNCHFDDCRVSVLEKLEARARGAFTVVRGYENALIALLTSVTREHDGHKADDGCDVCARVKLAETALAEGGTVL